MAQLAFTVLDDLATRTLAIVLLLAAVAKFREQTDFRRTLQSLGLVRTVPIVAIGIPAIEAVLGLAFATQMYLDAAAKAAVVLFSGFSSAGLVVILRGDTVQCSCFGGGPSRLGLKTVLTNLVLIMLAICVSSTLRPDVGLLYSTYIWTVSASVVVFYATTNKLIEAWQQAGKW